jgi:cardiolipin synthase
MSTPGWVLVVLFIADLGIRIGLSIRVIMRRRPVGVSLAWLFIILVFPFLGAFVYLLLGELRLGNRRMQVLRSLIAPCERWIADMRNAFQVDWTDHGVECEPLARLIENAAGMPALPGNDLQLLRTWSDALAIMIEDIDAATRSCCMEFYIWHLGGKADEVAEALVRAANRGVTCQVLLDAVGSSKFLASPLAKRLRSEGVHLQRALPGGPFRLLVQRFDLRMHRKVVVIDCAVAYTGSLNMVDPRFFKQKANVGQWVDAMVRVRGPAVEAVAIGFLGDWALEQEEHIEQIRADADICRSPLQGTSTVQVIPTGPTREGDALQTLLMTIYAARRELIITTPYFVPDEALLTALVSAARRGAEVTLVVPARVDSLLVRLASQSHVGELLRAGVRVMLFDGGLLHTKSVMVDGEVCLIGSLNLDPRSLYLNFEITLGIYDPVVCKDLRALQQSYIEQSRPLSLEAWNARPPYQRFTANLTRLMSPLL